MSCADGKIDTSELKNYELDGVKFALPRYMRATATEGYEASFDNLSIFFMVKRVDDEMLSAMGVTREDGAEKYSLALLNNSGVDKSKVYYESLEHRDLISFRYSYDASEGEGEKNNIFYYVILAGSGDNFWYFEICCPESISASNLSKFEDWRNSIILTK